MTGNKSFKNPCDVAVIGGGPVGSQTAYKLSQMGYRVLVFEKRPAFPAHICCTGIVSRECVETYEIPTSVIYRQANGATLITPTGRAVPVERDTPQAAILDRSAFNQLWAQRAVSAGAEYCYGAEVKNLKHGKNGITLEVSQQGNPASIQAKTVVVSTGFGARLMDGLGLGAAGDFVMGAQAEVETKNVDDVEVYFGSKVAPGFFGWLTPTGENKALVGVLSRRHPPAYLRSLLGRLVDEGKIVSAKAPFTYGGVPLRPLHRTYGDRLLVVGTAAGQVKPLTGGGIYYGLLCADMAANTLNRAFNSGDFSPAHLAGYERAWKRKLGSELRNGYFARRMYELLSDSQIDSVFKLMKTSGLIEEMEKSDDLSFDWHGAVVNRIFNHRLIIRVLKSLYVGQKGKKAV
ncbi:MAG: NAD(P)/FAD-dependent oxidoreductase [Dehalococcoidales bacterium]|nr:NAD(P)/FAD-dependent oxidoreductase [Dehalococcoidales bacterium]